MAESKWGDEKDGGEEKSSVSAKESSTQSSGE
jgi:hypothetical protein